METAFECTHKSFYTVKANIQVRDSTGSGGAGLKLWFWARQVYLAGFNNVAMCFTRYI